MPVAVDDSSGGAHTHAGEDVTSGTLADARLSTKVALDDSTHTFTNKSYDANGTGNVLTNIESADISGSAGITKAQISDTGAWGIAEIPDAGKKIAYVVAVGDETTVLTTGTNKVRFRMPFGFSCDEARAMLSTAGTGAALVTVDINDDGASLFSTVLTIDATEKTSEDAAAASVLTSTPLTIVDDSEMTVDIDVIDTDNVATGLKIALIGQRT